MDAVGAEHVCDLVRVGDDRGRPEGQNQPRECVGQELRRLEVHVGVDEARNDPTPGRVDDLLAVVVAQTRHVPVDDRDVDLEATRA